LPLLKSDSDSAGYENNLKWMRIIGNTLFSTGTVALALFVIDLKAGWSINKAEKLYQ